MFPNLISNPVSEHCLANRFFPNIICENASLELVRAQYICLCNHRKLGN